MNNVACNLSDVAHTHLQPHIPALLDYLAYNPIDLTRLMRVNRWWHRMINTPAIWMRVFIRYSTSFTNGYHIGGDQLCEQLITLLVARIYSPLVMSNPYKLVHQYLHLFFKEHKSHLYEDEELAPYKCAAIGDTPYVHLIWQFGEYVYIFGGQQLHVATSLFAIPAALDLFTADANGGKCILTSRDGLWRTGYTTHHFSVSIRLYEEGFDRTVHRIFDDPLHPIPSRALGLVLGSHNIPPTLDGVIRHGDNAVYQYYPSSHGKMWRRRRIKSF